MSAREPDAPDHGVSPIERLAATGRMATACTSDLMDLLEAIALGTRALGDAVRASPANLEQLERIREATARVAEITRMLIRLGRPPAGAGVVDLVDVVEDLGRMLRLVVAPGGRLVVIRREHELKVAVDRRAIEQALFDLVARAIDLTGGGRITVDLGLTSWPGGLVWSGELLPPGTYATLAVIPDENEAPSGDGDPAGLSPVRIAIAARVARAAGGGLVVHGVTAAAAVSLLLPIVT